MSLKSSTLTIIMGSILNRDDLTQDKLKSILTYYPDEGVFRWNFNSNARARKGDVAGTKGDGYRYITINGFKFAVHQLAFLYMEGYIPAETDHKDRIKSNNRWNNLMASSRKHNNRNRYDRYVFEYAGITQTLKEHCVDLCLNYNTIQCRVKHGMDCVSAIETPIRSKSNA